MSAASPKPIELANKVLPLEATLVPSVESQRALDLAVEHLTDKCMTTRGYHYLAYPAKPHWSFLDAAFRYGYIDAADAAKSGYRTTYPPHDPDFDKSVAAIDQQRAAFGDDYNTALYGGGDAEALPGCYPIAQRTIYGVAGGLLNMPTYQTVIALQAESSDRLSASDRAKSAIAEWSACMTTHGYTIATWQDARNKFGPIDPTADIPTSQAERQQALADSDCRHTTQLEAALFDTEIGIQSDIIDQHQAEIEALNDALALASRQAAANA